MVDAPSPGVLSSWSSSGLSPEKHKVEITVKVLNKKVLESNTNRFRLGFTTVVSKIVVSVLLFKKVVREFLSYLLGNILSSWSSSGL